jgi:hypothetical protein
LRCWRRLESLIDRSLRAFPSPNLDDGKQQSVEITGSKFLIHS